jgi:hypothetical protein
MNLPREPGLYRRLAYGEYIRTHHRSRYYNYNYNYNYEELVELEDVKLGLSNKELSCIFKNNTCTNQFFCSICQEQKYDINPELFNIKTLICDHTFHNKCIHKWLSKNKTCPVCRLDLSSD